jgi:hypothetical protein
MCRLFKHTCKLIFKGFGERRNKEWDWAYRQSSAKPVLAISFNDKKICNFLTNAGNHEGVLRYSIG